MTEKETDFDIIVAKTLYSTSRALTKDTQIDKKMIIPLSVVIAIHSENPLESLVREIKRNSRHLNRKKERAHLIGLSEIAKSLQFRENDDRDDKKRLSKLIKKIK